MGKVNLKRLEGLAKQKEITITLQRSLKARRAALAEKIKVINTILAKPIKKE